MIVQIDFNTIAQWLGGAAMSLACLIFLLVMVGLVWHFISSQRARKDA